MTFDQGSSRVHVSCLSIAFVHSPKALFLTENRVFVLFCVNDLFQCKICLDLGIGTKALAEEMSSASRIASLVSKKAGNSSQYKLKASWAPGPDSYSLHSPARKKWATKVTSRYITAYSYILHRTSKVSHCRRIEPRIQIFGQPRPVYVPARPISMRTLCSPYYMLRVIFFWWKLLFCSKFKL